MDKSINLINKRFGKLVVIGRAINGKRQAYWACKCDCGNEKVIVGNSLRRGRTKSCGCGHLDYVDKIYNKGYGDIAQWFWTYLHFSAKARGHEFSVTIEYCWDLFLKQNNKCALSGLPLKFAKRGREKAKFQTASLDRINSLEGYIENNVQWVHKDINYIKQDYDEKYFKELCRLVTENSVN